MRVKQTMFLNEQAVKNNKYFKTPTKRKQAF